MLHAASFAEQPSVSYHFRLILMMPICMAVIGAPKICHANDHASLSQVTLQSQRHEARTHRMKTR